MKLLISAIAVFSLVSAAAMAQAGTLPDSVRAGIDAGNQAWIDGVKIGDVARIIATHTENAVDCGPSGECITGWTQIEQHMIAQLASLGRARSASGTLSTNGGRRRRRSMAGNVWSRNI
jgi:hypothetical protein